MTFPFRWLSKEQALRLLGQLCDASPRHIAYVGVRDGQIRVRLEGRELRPDETYAILADGRLGEGGNIFALPAEFELHRDDLESLASRMRRTRVSTPKTHAGASIGSIKVFALEMEPLARAELEIGSGGTHSQVARWIAQEYEMKHQRRVSPDTIARYLRENRKVERKSRRTANPDGSDATG